MPFQAKPKKPDFQVPPNACDAHCHVFGPERKFPFAAKRGYTPVDAPQEKLAALHAHLGLSRAVIVQASCHGSDNRALVDALKAGPDTRRGIACVEPRVTDAELAELDAAGVRGSRFSFVKHLGGDSRIAAMRALARRYAEIGWHVAVYFDADRIDELIPALRALPVPVVIDHMGRVNASGGQDQHAFIQLQRLLEDERFWVKVSGVERISRAGPPFRDAVPFARTLVHRFPERVLWGTDWPHPNMHDWMPDDGGLVDLLPLIAPDEDQRQALLVDNPARLYWNR